MQVPCELKKLCWAFQSFHKKSIFGPGEFRVLRQIQCIPTPELTSTQINGTAQKNPVGETTRNKSQVVHGAVAVNRNSEWAQLCSSQEVKAEPKLGKGIPIGDPLVFYLGPLLALRRLASYLHWRSPATFSVLGLWLSLKLLLIWRWCCFKPAGGRRTRPAKDLSGNHWIGMGIFINRHATFVRLEPRCRNYPRNPILLPFFPHVGNSFMDDKLVEGFRDERVLRDCAEKIQLWQWNKFF